MTHKLDEIKHFIAKHNPDVLFVSESELKQDDVDRMMINGYCLELADSIKYGKARIIAYVKQPYVRKVSLEGEKENIMVIETKKERIIGIYRGFKNYHNPSINPLTYLFDLLEESCKTDKPLIMMGDFNIDPQRDALTPQGKLLEKLIIDNGLTQLVDCKTRRRVVTRQSGLCLEESMIDLILTNFEGVTIIDPSTSDHDLIGLHRKDNQRPHETNKSIIRDYVCLSPRNVARVISTWQAPTNLDDLEKMLSYVLDKLAPYRVIRTRLPENITNPKVEKIKKRRDRMYRKYKFSQDEHWLYIVKQENKKLKKMLISETRRIIQKKAEGANTKGFWQMVGQMQGRIPKSTPLIKKDGISITDPTDLANAFAGFFEDKITSLTSQMPSVNNRERELERMQPFSLDELNSSLKHFKTKMSAGPDGLPMRLIKFYVQKRPMETLSIFNNILQEGFPDRWRLARVTPVPKKGNLSDISNYRPVSNLSSLSKLFERCLLHRLMQLPNYNDLLGNHQHGFRQNHSTTTCLMTLKDEICENLDMKNKVIAYSLELSAAFDMLRPDTFKELMENKIPRALLGMIDEFLTDRKFYVEMNGNPSSIKQIDRGCPQGSVLGPVLFNLYTGTIKEKLPKDIMLTAYADDSYVVVSDSSEDSLRRRTEDCLMKHIDGLEQIGMKVNQSKTEIMAFGRDQQTTVISVKGMAIETKEAMKALGVTIDKGLTWAPHINNLKKRVMSIVGGVRMIRNKLTKQQTTNVVTAQFTQSYIMLVSSGYHQP